ncbi:helix-turn-helix domain-containing protein [Streptomyces johnsoniae]|uniref:MerR family transcriptional regulator n=1 Tax=Streptomyces johnsoniae TaxID=3075532 RepID=A0ABU2S721_9ACTN|nr:MerR family transcriptional regulator [Streptomyces sp. DSM 41886]MDT0444771.1 MerR family transcriptional regulator [Streptomyces sp. DSM 41886]
MSDDTELFTIGELARRTGLSVRTIRFWSDSGLVAPAGRSTGGYRLFDAGAIARLDLVRTLRELGLDLATVRRVLARQATVRDVATAHLHALDAEIRMLQVRRAVLRWVARGGSTTEEMRLMHKLAQMSAEERQRVIDEFVREIFDGVAPGAPGAHLAEAMRALPAELPADPAPEQVEAWVELAELVGDEGFRQRVREMAVAGAQGGQEPQGPDPALALEHAGGALRAGVAPESAAGGEILERIVGPDLPAAERAELADRLATFTDRRVERYWQLLGVLNGRPPAPPQVPAFEWLIAALRSPAGGP